MIEITIEKENESALWINQLKEETSDMVLLKNLNYVEWTKLTDFKVTAGNTVVGVSKGILAAR